MVTRAESSLDVVDGGVLVDRLPPPPFFACGVVVSVNVCSVVKDLCRERKANLK